MRRCAPVLIAALVLATPVSAPAQLDSQVVLNRYAARLLALDDPKVLIFTYTVTQAGPHNLDQAHRIYRSGDLVRDETISVDGQTLHPKITRFARYRDRYTIKNVAPRLTEYALLFLRSHGSGNHIEYAYRAVTLGPVGDFVVEGMTIEQRTYLPSEIRFHTTNGTITGTGVMTYAQSGRYWVPTAVGIQAKIGSIAARERIAFGGYRFPPALPKSTFAVPRALPTPTIPTF